MKWLIRKRWIRKILLKLPSWNWVLDLLYPDDLVIKFKDKDNG